MTRDIISSFSYIKGLTDYINQDNYPAKARDVAREHLADTLDKAVNSLSLRCMMLTFYQQPSVRLIQRLLKPL